MQTSDGLVRFSLAGSEDPREIDALLAVTIAEAVVATHGLVAENSSYIFTANFLRDLAVTFQSEFGLPVLSTSVAVKLWHAAQVEVYGLKKNTSERQGSLGPTESTPSS